MDGRTIDKVKKYKDGVRMELGKYLINESIKIGVDDIVVNFLSETSTQVKFFNNRVCVSKNWELESVDIFISYKKRLVAFSTTNLDKNYLLSLVKQIVKVAKRMEEKEFYGIAKGPFKYKRIPETFDRRIKNLNGKEIKFVEEAINSALNEGAARCSGTLFSSTWNEEVLTSQGIEGKDRGTSIRLSIRAFSNKESSAHSVVASRMLKRFDPKKAGREAGILCSQYTKPKKGRPGSYDVIFSPLAFAVLLSYSSYAFSAFEVEAGNSFLLEKLNKKIASEEVSLLDDARLKNGFGSRKFDDEGRPAQTNRLIENGVLKTYLHNTSTAKKFGARPTGNAGIIYPHPWNLVLEKGESNLEEMIASVKNGIYVTNLWYTRFSDYRKGDFSSVPRDAMFEIKNGEMIPIKELRLSSNMSKIFENICLISRERKMISGWEVPIPVLTGWVLCKNLTFTRPFK